MTIGAELELQLLNYATHALSSSSPRVLERFPNSPIIKKEIFQSMVEITSGIRKNAGDVGKDLREAACQLRKVCDSLDIQIASAGTHPFSSYKTSEVYPDERYLQVLEKHRWLARKLLIFGLHVHVGMRNGDHAVQVSSALTHYLPLLLALSSSSPFNMAEDTHFSSSRSTLFGTLPNSGQACEFQSWSDFQEMYRPLVESGSIDSYRDLWWDVRPSPAFGTLEIRICDAPSTILEAEAIVALTHLLCQKIDRDLTSGDILLNTPSWIVRENKWRAIQKGTQAEMLTSENGETKTVSEFLSDILSEMSDLIELNGYHSQIKALKNIAELGSSADRQRLRYENSGKNFDGVLRGLVDELKTDVPMWTFLKESKIKPKKGGTQCA